MRPLRTFIAVVASPEIRAAARRVAQQLAPVAYEVRWVVDDNLHWTLQFLGDVERAGDRRLIGIGLVGLPSSEEQRLSVALKRAEAAALFFAPARLPQPEAIRSCHALAIHVRPETAGSPWLDPALVSAADPPIVLIGERIPRHFPARLLAAIEVEVAAAGH